MALFPANAPRNRHAGLLADICSSFGSSIYCGSFLSKITMPSTAMALLVLAATPWCLPGTGMLAILACMPKKAKAKAKPRAAPLDHGDLNRMLTSLRYQASDKCNDVEKKKAAKECQAKWNSLVNNEDKRRFLQLWEKNGRGKTAESLQFAVRFEQSCDHIQEDEFASKDKFLIPAQILKLKGYSMADFDSRKEAIKFAVDLYEENAKEFETKADHPPSLHPTNEELSRYFFVEDEGRKKIWKQRQSKKITGGTDVKTGAQLLGVCDSMGVPSGLPSSSSGSKVEIKDEDPAIPEVKEAAQSLKTEGETWLRSSLPVPPPPRHNFVGG